MSSFMGYGSPQRLEQAIEESEGKPSDEFCIYAEGLVSASVCSSLREEEVERRMARVITGVGKWTLAKGDFSDGNPNPCACDKKPNTHKHYLFHC